MDQDQFWRIIDEACGRDQTRSEEWDRRLQDVLIRHTPDEILDWDRIFDRLAIRAYTVDLWGAAYVINGGASDDGFYYFAVG